jgi:NAD(P)-dependent dehydrogenase (short-subunit alcohol dehydrogenase family)
MVKKTALITGVSTGLGRGFARALLEPGHRVIGTVRRTETVAEFEAIKPGEAFACVLDVTEGGDQSIAQARGGIYFAWIFLLFSTFFSQRRTGSSKEMVDGRGSMGGRNLM